MLDRSSMPAWWLCCKKASQMSLLFATQPYEQLETIQIILQAIVEIKGTWYNQATDFSFI